MNTGRRIEIHGIVQGVGFRPLIYRLAAEERIAGRIRNDPSGVTIEAFGPREALDLFVRRIEASTPAAAEIRTLSTFEIPPEPVDVFAIAPSGDGAIRHVSIPSDMVTCDACLAEILDPANRRYRYPFTTCTACGPRFTITLDVPYDRPNTTMSRFAMCDACTCEYANPADRRFHAETNACPVCGPKAWLVNVRGERVTCDDAIAAAAEALIGGAIVAVKGIGGFHLACDATSAAVVDALRIRKRREEKPFAVMVWDLAAAEAVAELTGPERELLRSRERPIVLARRREPHAIADGVAPRSSLVGVMLPYSPLHHLLLRDAARPLVMTSGNLSDEPIACRNGEALERLRTIADLFLLHDRDIDAPCDDSVARVIDRRAVVIRRSRGWVPRPIGVTSELRRPVLGCGGELKNTFCLASGDLAYLGPHIGDLHNLDTYDCYQHAVERMEHFLGIRPEVVAHDRHPHYMSTAYALAHRAQLKIAVQHHHAHVASAMAEHRLDGPVIGVAFDGTGYGHDGTAWGAEVLVARYDAFERAGTFRAIPLPGGDAAILEPWRIALSLLEDAFDGEAALDRFQLFATMPESDLRTVRRMMTAQLRSPLARGIGRYFDGIGSLVLTRPRASYEGQIATEWNVIADSGERRGYAFDVDSACTPRTVDLRPMVRAIAHDMMNNVPAPTIAARFHNTLGAATVDLVRDASRSFGRLPVVLTGGCFQNARLAEGVARALDDRFRVYLHERVPPGDGGIALGQVMVANAVARSLGE